VPHRAIRQFGAASGLLGYRLLRAQDAMHRDFMAAVASLDLTQKQAATLWLIDSNPGVAQISVATALGMDRATMVAVVDRLEQRNLIVRKRSTADRRRPGALPDTGRSEHAAQGQGVHRQARRPVRCAFTAAELESLLAALQKLQHAG
jgi:DNA-binding MarR family transcriptional regulator